MFLLRTKGYHFGALSIGLSFYSRLPVRAETQLKIKINEAKTHSQLGFLLYFFRIKMREKVLEMKYEISKQMKRFASVAFYLSVGGLRKGMDLHTGCGYGSKNLATPSIF